MLKKKILIPLIISVFTALFGFAICSFADENDKANAVTIDLGSISTGVVKIKFTGDPKTVLKATIVKDAQQYVYDVSSDGTEEVFPLQMGNGDYKITVLEGLGNNLYRPIVSKDANLNLADPDSVYLASVQNIKWDKNYDAIKKDSDLIGKEKDDNKKLEVVYNFLVKQITYDYSKIKTLKTGYIPDVAKTYEAKKGICYDYSSLFAAMKRSEGIPTRLVKGYTKNVNGYHAWNEIKINDKWIVLDTTYDSTMSKNRMKYQMVKNPEDYKAAYIY